MSIQIKELSNCEIEITYEISGEEFDKFWGRAVKEMSLGVKMDGFRPGNIPEKVVISKVGENAVLEKAGEIAIRDTYSKIIKEKKLDAIGLPRASILKIAKSAPFSFKIVTAILPEIKLPENYKEIANKVMSKKEEVKVEEKEIDTTLEQLRKMKISPEEKQKEKPKLPELNDEFAKSVGKFETLNELKDALKQNIKYEKEMKKKQEKRIESLDEILKEMKFDIPQVLVDGEKKNMMNDFKTSITSMGMKWEDYLKQIKKTEGEIYKGWDAEALKRVKYGLLLEQLGREIDFEITDSEVEEKIKTFHIHEGPIHGDAGNVDQDKLKDYAYGIIRNEKIFNFLETC